MNLKFWIYYILHVAGWQRLFITAEYQPNWESLSKRIMPAWFQKAKYGILIHWGLYASQGVFGESFYEDWIVDQQPFVVEYMKKYYPNNFEFQELVSSFTCEFFDANQWAKIINTAEAKYVIVTAKYNDGYALWNSTNSPDWNSLTSGPKINIIGELAAAIRSNTKAKFGLHYSFQDNFNPFFIDDKRNNFRTNAYTEYKLIPELKEMVSVFKPDIVWIDGATSNDAPYKYYNSTEFLAWLFTKRSAANKNALMFISMEMRWIHVRGTVVVNDKWGKGTTCKYGGYFSCSPPAHRSHSNQNKTYVWESLYGIARQGLGHRSLATLQDYRSTEEIIEALVSTISLGGNFLLAIGATKDGRITPYVEERLRDVGQWLTLYGEAIFESVPWEHNRDTINRNIWYTSKQQDDSKYFIYVILLKWPPDNLLRLHDPIVTEKTKIYLIGYSKSLEYELGSNGVGLVIDIQHLINEHLLPWGWVFKIE
ncbi:hypothetical protein CHUAL_007096 [Chamberlinius hualienensis]